MAPKLKPVRAWVGLSNGRRGIDGMLCNRLPIYATRKAAKNIHDEVRRVEIREVRNRRIK